MPVIINDVEVVIQDEPRQPSAEPVSAPSAPPHLPARELRRILAAADQRRLRLLAD